MRWRMKSFIAWGAPPPVGQGFPGRAPASCLVLLAIPGQGAFTGQTRDRGALVARFQAGEVPLFLISLKADGTKRNLTAADSVIHYVPWCSRGLICFGIYFRRSQT